MDQWPEMLTDLGRSHDEVIDRLERVIRRQEYMREQFAPKAEARFLERKNELDQVVYSLLRLANSFWPVRCICRSIQGNPTLLIWPSATPRVPNATPMASLVRCP